MIRLSPGTVMTFKTINHSPNAEIVHPHEGKKYTVFVFDHEGVETHVPLPIQRMYSDDKPEEWHDNMPAVMFQAVPKSETQTPVLFLDIDGVLNNDEHMQMLTDTKALSGYAHATPNWFGLQVAPELRSRLQKVIDAVPDILVVVSSSWRFALSKDDLSAVLQTPVHDTTVKYLPGLKFSESAPRGAEIQAWLDDNAASGPFIYAVVDDLAEAADGYDTTKHREVPGLHSRVFVRTDGTKGITAANVDDIIQKLRAP